LKHENCVIKVRRLHPCINTDSEKLHRNALRTSVYMCTSLNVWRKMKINKTEKSKWETETIGINNHKNLLEHDKYPTIFGLLI
jgi:hypothetical protein